MKNHELDLIVKTQNSETLGSKSSNRKRSMKISIQSNSKQSEAGSKKMTVSQLKENLKFASWEQPKQTEGERRYQ